MEAIADVVAARRALRRYLGHAEGQLKPDTFETLEKLSDAPSSVDAICQSAELLYARRDELDEAGQTIVAQLASFGASSMWHGLDTGNRGGLIAQAMRRDLGLKVQPGQAKPQKADDDPQPLPQHTRPAEPAA